MESHRKSYWRNEIKALELAALCECYTPMPSQCDDIAAELRRLAEVNAELLRALGMCSVAFKSIANEIPDTVGYAEKCACAVDAVIAKAKEQK